MKRISLVFLSCLAAVSFAQAESAAGVDFDQPSAEQRPDKPKREKGQQGDRGRPSREEVLKQFDADGDGKLNETEKQAAHEARKEQMLLRRFDKDRDGALSAEERAKADEFIAKREAKMLEKYDADGDGVISPEERKQARQNAKEHRQGDRPGKGAEGNRGQGPNREGPPRSDEPGDMPPPPQS